MKKKIFVIAVFIIVISLIAINGTKCAPTETLVPTENPVFDTSIPEASTHGKSELIVPTEPSSAATTNPNPTESVETKPSVIEPPTNESPTEPSTKTPEKFPVETRPSEDEETMTSSPSENENSVSNGHKFTDVNELVYANTTVNIRTGPSTDYEKIGTLHLGDTITRIGKGDSDWDKVLYNDVIAYMYSDYLQTDEPVAQPSLTYPLIYSDSTCKITIYREWFENAWIYAAHIEFTDYTRLKTDCANGSYRNGCETTSHAAKRLDAILAINGCYSAPSLDYSVVRNGKIWNGADRDLWIPAIYSANNGLLLSAWESGGDNSVAGKNIQQLVDDGLLTDTFCFGPPGLINGVLQGSNEGARAQRTFIGTNGNAGDIWLCVSDGRYNDGESAGLTFYQAMKYLKDNGCVFGVHLDGGGSSTMVFQGKVLNAANGNERAVVDFVYFK